MAEQFFETLKSVGIFLIIGQTILHFRPAKKYEKYMKMTISIMVMSQLMIPVFSIFQQDIEGIMGQELEKYTEELNQFERQQTLLEEEIIQNSQQEYEEFQIEVESGLDEILSSEETKEIEGVEIDKIEIMIED